MLCLSGFQLYSRWVPLAFNSTIEIIDTKQDQGFLNISVCFSAHSNTCITH